MNKLILITFFVWVTLSNVLHAQNGNAGAYTESVTVHINNEFLITGETLYYSIHCMDVKKNKYSALSKLAYVELIGEDEKAWLQAKVLLTDGRGAGDFFLPSTLPSGNYTLIAYTKWMRNFPLKNFYRKQITIVNPYVKPVGDESQSKIVNAAVNPIRPTNPKVREGSGQIRITTDKKSYSQRQKVMVTIKNNDPLHSCEIAMNVHCYDEKLAIADDAIEGTDRSSASRVEKGVTILPDLRGETIAGVVKDKSTHQAVANTGIYLSIPGSPYNFQMSRTDSSGRFYFSSKNIQTQAGIRFQVDKPESTDVELTLDDEFVNDYHLFKPAPFLIDTTLRRQVEQRNVYSQIENAYFFKKPDSIRNFPREPFFGKPDKVYNLDDFTRFPTMEDVFREYMFEVAVTKRDGKFNIQLFNSNSASRFFNTPLILVDGVRIFDISTLMNYNPLLIKSISLVTRSYVFAGILFDGVLSVNTYEGNAKELPVPIIQKEYTSWQRSKKYYAPKYKPNESLNRIPDYRFQLFWDPVITIGPGEELVKEFYTSDIDGDFLIEVKGFNSSGAVVNANEIIQVVK